MTCKDLACSQEKAALRGQVVKNVLYIQELESALKQEQNYNVIVDEGLKRTFGMSVEGESSKEPDA